MKPERALRLLDAIDGIVYATRLAVAGHWGRRLRRAGVLAGVALGLALARWPGGLAVPGS